MDYRYIPFYVQGNAITGLYYGQWQMAEDRDIDYVKEMYPMTFSRIQELIEKECDMQEYTGSMMFDEYPEYLKTYDRRKQTAEREIIADNILTTSGLKT